jgi:hypothetical protein
VDLGSPVSPDYVDRRPFRFEGTIERVDVEVFAVAATAESATAHREASMAAAREPGA